MEGTIAYGWKLDLFLISDGWIRIEIIQVWFWNIDSFDLELIYLLHYVKPMLVKRDVFEGSSNE